MAKDLSAAAPPRTSGHYRADDDDRTRDDRTRRSNATIERATIERATTERRRAYVAA